MGKKDKNKKKGKGAEKTAMKTDKKLAVKQRKMLEKIGEADITKMVENLEKEQERIEKLVEETCLPPGPRSNFSLVAHPEKDELIMFGGEFFNGQRVEVYNDLYFYSVAKNEWKQVRSPHGPAPRSGHQMVSIATDNGQLWLFGGEYASPSQLQFYHFKDLWRMDLKDRSWTNVRVNGGPSARSGHRMIAGKKRLIIFGGFHDNNQSYQYFNDVHIFSLEQYIWLKLDISSPVIPPPRSGCCMALCPDGKILVWGGYSKTRLQKDVDLGTVHTDMFALVPHKTNPNEKLTWTTIKARGYKPLPRSGVGCCVSVNGIAYCFGGVMDVDQDEEDVKGEFGNELYSLDLSNYAYNQVEIADKPVKLSKSKSKNEMEVEEIQNETDSQTTVTTDGIFTVTVAGPSSSNSVTKSTLSSEKCSKNKPSPRMNASICVLKGVLYLFGGIFEEDKRQKTFNDFYALDLKKLNDWKVIIPNNWNNHDWIESDSSDSSDDDDDSNSDDNEDDSDEDSEMETD